jgi:hypothetical protein
MATVPYLILYGNSVFLAGIKAEFENLLTLELVSMDAGSPDVAGQIRASSPCLVLFDLTEAQTASTLTELSSMTFLRGLPGLQLIGVDLSSDELLVLSSYPLPVYNLAELIKVIQYVSPGR